MAKEKIETRDKAKTAIKITDLHKVFKLPHEKRTSIKSVFVNIFRRQTFEKQVVLDGVSLEIKEGEFFGIVGRNGSGKSTLLKLLAGIYNPTSGSLEVNGRLTPFIELGVGFNPELTGRQNVFLNGALLGFTRKEMESMYDDIVRFAELGKFMDQKLKNYSSGMHVRLAFSIAIRVRSDILLIDEVLAVGDANFQNKCIDVFKKLKAAGKTIVFISHDMGMVKRFCDRAVMIQKGKIVAEGHPQKIAEIYEDANLPSDEDRKTVRTINQEIKARTSKIVTNIELLSSGRKNTDVFEAGEEITVSTKLATGSPAKNIGIAVYTKDDGYVFGTNTIVDKVAIGKEVKYTFKANLGEGEYKLKIGLFGKTDDDIYEFFENGPTFYVRSADQDKAGWQGITHLPHDWHIKAK